MARFRSETRNEENAAAAADQAAKPEEVRYQDAYDPWAVMMPAANAAAAADQAAEPEAVRHQDADDLWAEPPPTPPSGMEIVPAEGVQHESALKEDLEKAKVAIEELQTEMMAQRSQLQELVEAIRSLANAVS